MRANLSTLQARMAETRAALRETMALPPTREVKAAKAASRLMAETAAETAGHLAAIEDRYRRVQLRTAYGDEGALQKEFTLATTSARSTAALMGELQVAESKAKQAAGKAIANRIDPHVRAALAQAVELFAACEAALDPIVEVAAFSRANWVPLSRASTGAEHLQKEIRRLRLHASVFMS